MTAIEAILGEFIDAWNAGRRPEVDEYLERAPEPERDRLAEQIATWLEIAPTPDYDEATRERIRQEPALMAALDAAAVTRQPLSTRLPALRARAGLAVGDVARRLTAIFELDDEHRADEYLQRIERDELDERRLSRRLTDALAAVLRVDPEQLMPQRPPLTSQSFFRADDDTNKWVAQEIDALSRAALAPAPEPMDELDRLFLGGPAG